MSTKCERKPSARSVRQVKRHFENVTERLVKKCEKAEGRIGRTHRLFVVPQIRKTEHAEILAAWEDAAENAIDATADAIASLKSLRARIEAAGMLNRLKTALAEIEVPDAAPVDEARADILRRAAAEAAETVREAHAAVHADEYLGTLRAVLDRLAASRAMDHLGVIGHRPTLETGRLTRMLIHGEPLSEDSL